MTIRLSCFALILLLSACAGGRNSADPEVAQDDETIRFQELNELFLQLEDNVDTFDRTPSANLPGAGTVRYEGVARAIIYQTNEAVLGNAYVDVSFSDDTLSGAAGDFFLVRSEASTPGELVFADGQISRDAPESSLVVQATGQITFLNGVAGIDTELEGGFTSSSADHLFFRNRDMIDLGGGDVDTIFLSVIASQ